ncbi:MAG: SxtJ family membrane protein [Lacibacter sp.]
MKWQQKHTSLVTIIAGFLLLYFLFKKDWLLVPVGIGVFGLLFGNIGDIIHHSWMKLAKLLGFINSRVILTVLFFFILTPVAFLMRLFGKGSFLKSKPPLTAFVTRVHIYKKEDLQNPF